MPQLNPNPWFMILLMSWLAYMMFNPKTNKFKTINELMMKNNKNMSKPWNWPWM